MLCIRCTLVYRAFSHIISRKIFACSCNYCFFEFHSSTASLSLVQYSFIQFSLIHFSLTSLNSIQSSSVQLNKAKKDMTSLDNVCVCSIILVFSSNMLSLSKNSKIRCIDFILEKLASTTSIMIRLQKTTQPLASTINNTNYIVRVQFVIQPTCYTVGVCVAFCTQVIVGVIGVNFSFYGVSLTLNITNNLIVSRIYVLMLVQSLIPKPLTKNYTNLLVKLGE